MVCIVVDCEEEIGESKQNNGQHKAEHFYVRKGPCDQSDEMSCVAKDPHPVKHFGPYQKAGDASYKPQLEHPEEIKFSLYDIIINCKYVK